ncbi:MAG TPA: RIP metalloprotease RseP [Myxococcota bacterium]|nr:RIP metalloprotease RseP [Myxococcota bacterium]
MSYFAAALLVAVLIFVHEFGHFVVAKAFRVGVPVFSLGFGRRLFGFVFRGTDYRVSLIPFGGYVRMEGADPFQDGGEGAESLGPNSFMNKPVWQRLLIVAAGPAMNLVLPVVVFSLLYMAGQPQASTQIGRVDIDSVAWDAGLRSGDRIVAVDGAPVTIWADMATQMGGADDELALSVDRLGNPLEIVLPVTDELRGDSLGPSALGLAFHDFDTTVAFEDPLSPAGQAGLRFGDRITAVDGVEIDGFHEMLTALDLSQAEVTVEYSRLVDEEETAGAATLRRQPFQPRADDAYANDWGLAPAQVFVGAISPDSPAQSSSLAVGDRIIEIDGRGIDSFEDILRRVRESASGEELDSSTRPVVMTLVRRGRTLDVRVIPEMVEDSDAYGNYQTRPIIGFSAGGGSVPSALESKQYPITEAVPKAVETTWSACVIIVETIGKIITGEADPKKTVGGPVRIVKAAADAAESGIFEWAGLMAGLSVSLAIVNFLPVPVLDGGQFVFYLLEGIRGRPLPLVVRERAQQIGVLLLIGLMFVVFVLDINNVFGGG